MKDQRRSKDGSSCQEEKKKLTQCSLLAACCRLTGLLRIEKMVAGIIPTVVPDVCSHVQLQVRTCLVRYDVAV